MMQDSVFEIHKLTNSTGINKFASTMTENRCSNSQHTSVIGYIKFPSQLIPMYVHEVIGEHPCGCLWNK